MDAAEKAQPALLAGAARRTINPPLGTGKGGVRLFGDPIQAIESDLTATTLVLANGNTKLALIATDLGLLTMGESDPLRNAVAAALGVPPSHVLFNVSHNHSAPSLNEWMAMTDEPEDARLRIRYARDLEERLVETALEADNGLRPARIGTGWGQSAIGVYRREQREGAGVLVLGEVPGHPIDMSVGVMRVDDLDGSPIAVASAIGAPGGRRGPLCRRLERLPRPRPRCSPSAVSAGSACSSRAAAATSIQPSESAGRSTAATRRPASASSSAARR